MAHFAKIGNNSKVLQVLIIEDKHLLNADNIEDESVGQQYLEQHNNWPAQMWIQTSYNTMHNQHLAGGTPFRGNCASIGGTWDEDNNMFWPKKPYPSWVKHIESATWKSPIGDEPALTEEQTSQNTAGTHLWGHDWNEEGQTWDLTNRLA